MIKTATTGATDDFSLVVRNVPGLFYRVNGINKSNVDGYVQLHDSSSLPANGAVPLKTWVAQANFEFNENILDGIPCVNGIVLALSSTATTLTLATGTKSQLQCEYEEYETLAVKPALTTGTATGNTTGIWAQGTSPAQRLVSVTWTNGEAGNAYLMLFGYYNPAVGAKPLWVSPVVASGNTGRHSFGYPGRLVMQSMSGVNYTDGFLAVSSTADKLTVGVAGTSTFATEYHS
jgi:hypothetical protein